MVLTGKEIRRRRDKTDRGQSRCEAESRSLAPRAPWTCMDLHRPARLLPGAPSRKAGALGPHSLRRLLQTPHSLPEPGWALSWGQVGAYCPCWARPGSEGLAGHLLRGSGQDGGAWRLARGSVLGSPPARSGSGGDSARTAGASSPPPRAGLPPSDPPPSPATHRPLLVSMATGQCCAQTSSLGGRQGTSSFCTTPR